jgi:hypothetical protein
MNHLRAKVSASCAFVVSRANSMRMSCNEMYRYTKVRKIEGSYTVLLYVTLYTIICTHTELLNDIDTAQLLYHVTV